MKDRVQAAFMHSIFIAITEHHGIARDFKVSSKGLRTVVYNFSLSILFKLMESPRAVLCRNKNTYQRNGDLLSATVFVLA